MDDSVIKTSVICNTEKRIEIFYNKKSECKSCNMKMVLKRYYDKKG